MCNDSLDDHLSMAQEIGETSLLMSFTPSLMSCLSQRVAQKQTLRYAELVHWLWWARCWKECPGTAVWVV